MGERRSLFDQLMGSKNQESQKGKQTDLSADNNCLGTPKRKPRGTRSSFGEKSVCTHKKHSPRIHLRKTLNIAIRMMSTLDRIMTPSPDPKDIYALSPGAREYGSLHGKAEILQLGFS